MRGLDEEPGAAVRKYADYGGVETAGYFSVGGTAGAGMVFPVAAERKHAVDYGTARNSSDLGADAVALLSQSGKVEFSVWRLPVECVWIAAVCVVAVEELVRPYGNEARSLEGT